MLTLWPALGRVLVLLVSTVALCVVGLVFASGTAVFALLDWTAFGRNREELAVYTTGRRQQRHMRANNKNIYIYIYIYIVIFYACRILRILLSF
jgi:nitrate/nitrite transporter NarK